MIHHADSAYFGLDCATSLAIIVYHWLSHVRAAVTARFQVSVCAETAEQEVDVPAKRKRQVDIY